MQKPKHVDFTADPAATTELLAQWEEHVEHDFVRERLKRRDVAVQLEEGVEQGVRYGRGRAAA